jgi:hypothetical protein
MVLDPRDLEKEMTEFVENNARNGGRGQFLVAWIGGFFFLMATFQLFTDQVPPLVQSIFQYSIPISVALSLIATILGSLSRNTPREARNFALIFSGIIALIITIVSMVTAAFPKLVSLEQFELLQADVSELESEVDRLQTTVTKLQEFDLNPSQLTRLAEVLSEQGFVTSSDLEEIFSGETLQREVLEILKTNNYVTVQELSEYTTEEDVLAIVQAQGTAVAIQNAEATSAAQAIACYIEPVSGYNSVGIRSSPEVRDDNLMRVLYKGERMVAVGHNGRTVNVDRWWLVKFSDGTNEVFGWISSTAVKEISEHSCGLVEQVPGS